MNISGIDFSKHKKELQEIIRQDEERDSFAIEELEQLKAEIEEIKMKEPLMSKGFECYGFKDKTPEDIKTEIIEMLDNRIAELKGEQE